MTHDEAEALARAVLDGQPRSYVQAARELARYVLAVGKVDRGACTCTHHYTAAGSSRTADPRCPEHGAG